jgi:hypothetical protein
MPFFTVSIDSLGSIGASVEPIASHCTTWTIMKTHTPASTAARFQPRREPKDVRRGAPEAPSTGSFTVVGRGEHVDMATIVGCAGNAARFAPPGQSYTRAPEGAHGP